VVLTLLMLIGDYRDRGECPVVVLLQHQVVRVAGHSGRPRQDQVRRELLGEPGDGPQALEVLDDSP